MCFFVRGDVACVSYYYVYYVDRANSKINFNKKHKAAKHRYDVLAHTYLIILIIVIITIKILYYSPVWLIGTRGRLRRRRQRRWRRRWQPRPYRRRVDSRSDDDPAAAAAAASAAAAATTVVADAIRCCVWRRWWLWRARPGQLMTLSRRSAYCCPSRRLRCNILYILYNKIYYIYVRSASRKGPSPPPPPVRSCAVGHHRCFC